MRTDLPVAAALVLGSAVVLVAAAAPQELRHESRPHYSMALPGDWQRTAAFACPPDIAAGDPDCFDEAYYRAPSGAWLRVAVDPPGEPSACGAVLTIVKRPDGSPDPVRTVPDDAAALNAVAVTETSHGRRYVLLHGGGPDGHVDVNALRVVVASFEPR